MEEQPELLPPVAIDLDFIHRIYRTSALLALFVGLLLWSSLGRSAALGWLIGCVLSLLLLAGVEWSVRRFIRPESRSPGSLLLVSLGKLLLFTVLLGLAFAGATKGWVALIWLLPGFSVCWVVTGLKFLGWKVLQASGSSRER